MKKRLAVAILLGGIIVACPATSHAQQQYDFTQRITSLECTASEVRSGGAIHHDLYPEECWRMSDAPATPTAPANERTVDDLPKGNDSGTLAPTGSSIHYILFMSTIFAAGILLYVRKHAKVLIFYHKHDNIEVLDHKKQKKEK